MMRLIRNTIFLLYVAVIMLMAIASIVERQHGATYASQHIYHSVWFMLLWGMLSVLSLWYVFLRHLHRRHLVFTLHLSLIVILLGATVTHFTNKDGVVHLRLNETKNTFVDKVSGQQVTLPFALTLDKFHIDCYEGTETPSDFVSEISIGHGDQRGTIATQVSMNRIFKEDGYRFYQNSFDPDEQGSTLTVVYDPWGTTITYTGYCLFALAMMAMLFSRHETFRRLLAHPSLRIKQSVMTFLAVCTLTVMPITKAYARSVPTINKVKAERASRMPIIYNGRIAPLNTLAIDFMQKVYGKNLYKGLSPEQVIYGWTSHPEAWKDEEMILIKDHSLRSKLGVTSRYASMQQLFDKEGRYRLLPLLQQDLTSVSNPIRDLDEKVGLILMLANGTLITPLPVDVKAPKSSKIEAELIYNKIPFCKILFISSFIMAIIGFVVVYWTMAAKCQTGKNRKRKLAVSGLSLMLLVCIAFHLIGFSLHAYISGRFPLANGYETMLLMGLFIQVAAFVSHRQFVFSLPIGFLLSGLTFLVAYLGQKTPQITSLMPVLHSPILSFHVSVIMMAYALLAYMMANSLFALVVQRTIKKDQPSGWDIAIEQLTVLNRILLYPAVLLLAIGIFLGAVWANISWGTYWSWDPKEVWALITLMVYGAAFHPPLNKPEKDTGFHLFCIFSFLTVLMTYFGVNYFLGGMHSYS